MEQKVLQEFGTDSFDIRIVRWTSGIFHAVVRVDGSPMVDLTLEYKDGTPAMEFSNKGLDRESIVWASRLQKAMLAATQLHSLFLTNTKWARVLAASNHGLSYEAYESVAQMICAWAEGISESRVSRPQYSETEVNDIMDAEVCGFLEDVLGLETLPGCWSHIEQAVKGMSND